MIDRAHIGKTWPSWEVEIEKGRLRLLAKAIGETRPIYLDEAAARAAGYRSIVAPPTMAFCLLADDPNALGYLDELGVPLARMLHGQQRIVSHEPLCAGDRVSVTRSIREISTKRNGALELITFDVEIRDAADHRPYATAESVLVIRHA